MTARTYGTCGMVCPACQRLLEMKLERIEGVVSAEANVQLGTTSVVFDPEAVDEWTIAEAIYRSGFDMTLSRDGGDRPVAGRAEMV